MSAIIEGFEARCCDCDATYSESLTDPTRRAENSQIINRDLWCNTHYEIHGHHRFRLARVSEREISVAKLGDPNQLRLRDDPDNAHLDPSNWGMKP